MIPGASYACRNCNGWFHDSCAKEEVQHLSDNILHPLHSEHQLTYLRFDLNWDFFCERCLCISSGSRYSCSSCDFNLDLTCASSSSANNYDLLYVLKSMSLEDQGKTTKKMKIQHYSHNDKLTLFQYRKIKADDYNCSWCEKRLCDLDVCYGCIEDGFFLHEGCIKKIPRTIIHPFHPNHSLSLQYVDFTIHCHACGEIAFDRFSPGYVCQAKSCKFFIDFRCSKLFPTLKHECHDDHLLTYFGNITADYQINLFECNVCWKRIGDNFYRCVECGFNLHLQCLSLPSSATHKYHRHPLMLLDSFKEDDSGEYYCDVCENERNPIHPVYYCEKCTYIAHIECILQKNASEELPYSVPQSMDEALIGKEMEQVTDNGNIYLNRPLIHKHPLKFDIAVENLAIEPAYCRGCLLIIRGPGYRCTECYLYKFFLHEKCAKLPSKIQHSFHSSHPLYLYGCLYPPDTFGLMICDECRDICLGFIYLCEECNFKLDVKCADHTSTVSKKERKKDHIIFQMDRATQLHHFTHPQHMLILVNSSDPLHEIECKICELSVLGPAYLCLNPNCHRFIIHESCLGLPQKMQPPFHLDDHMLVISSTPYGYNTKSQCYACSLSFGGLGVAKRHDNFGYSCEQCDVQLHSVCANSLRWPLKCNSHDHNLYYFGTNCQLLFGRYVRLLGRASATVFCCNKCQINCNGKPFYRCLECAINFHLGCVPIPGVVKSGCHRHPLILKDSFTEDDSAEYYCDVCEEERYGNDHVYYCEECNGLFVSHIECALAKVDCGEQRTLEEQEMHGLHKKQNECEQAGEFTS